VTFTQEFTVNEFLEALSPTELRTIKIIAKTIGCSGRLAERRLDALVDAGLVGKLK